MPTSTASPKSPSSPSASPASAPSSPPSSVQETSSVQEKRAKLSLADQARLMQDNQRALDLTAASNRAYRQQAQQLREAQVQAAVQSLGSSAPATPPNEAESMGDINIDSPTTIYQLPPPAAAPAPASPAPTLASPTGATPTAGLLAKLAPWLLGAAGLAAGAGGLGYGLRPTAPAPVPAPAVAPAPAAPVNTTVNKGFSLQLLPKAPASPAKTP